MKNKIKCLICGEEFSQLTYQHLKKHDILPSDYRIKYGHTHSEALREKISKKTISQNTGRKLSDATKRKISKAKKGKPAKNKGSTHTAATKAIISQKALERLKDKTSHPMYGKSHTEASKKKLSDAQTEYATTNPEQMSDRGRRALITRVNNGHKPLYQEACEKRTPESYVAGAIKSNKTKSHNAMLAKIDGLKSLGLELDDDFYPVAGKGTWRIKCINCGIKASRHSQMFDPYRQKTEISCFGLCISHTRSSHEINLAEYITNLGVPNEIGNRSLISPLEIDIYIPEQGMGIEMCGLYWHGENHGKYGKGKDRTYHRDKYLRLKEQNKSLITIFEDEWVNKKQLVLSMIKNRIGKGTAIKIGARKCSIRIISAEDAKPFMENNHIGGYSRSKLKYGLFYGDNLISVMTFSKGEVSRKNTDTWEISRFATKQGWNVQGGASKLFNAFIKDEKPAHVISYADLRWGEGNVYSHLGFTRLDDTVPNYWYYPINCYPLKRHHRYTLRKNSDDDPNMTEWENRQLQGWNRIWDCGNAKWEWCA